MKKEMNEVASELEVLKGAYLIELRNVIGNRKTKELIFQFTVDAVILGLDLVEIYNALFDRQKGMMWDSLVSYKSLNNEVLEYFVHLDKNEIKHAVIEQVKAQSDESHKLSR
jgi:hypothetical protein